MGLHHLFGVADRQEDSTLLAQPQGDLHDVLLGANDHGLRRGAHDVQLVADVRRGAVGHVAQEHIQLLVGGALERQQQILALDLLENGLDGAVVDAVEVPIVRAAVAVCVGWDTGGSASSIGVSVSPGAASNSRTGVVGSGAFSPGAHAARIDMKRGELPSFLGPAEPDASGTNHHVVELKVAKQRLRGAALQAVCFLLQLRILDGN